MKTIAMGMNHQIVSVELVGSLTREPGSASRALASMKGLDCSGEGLFLSTCNRVEALFTTEDYRAAKNSVISILSGFWKVSEGNFLSSLYTFEDRDAVTHLFRVGSSLDSMVVGEPQILGQIEEAYSQAVKEKTTGVILKRLMHRAFHVAKRVRTETGICDAAVLISYAAVELAKKIFHVLDGKRVLLIGAGQMAGPAGKHLIKHGVGSMRVANRTLDQAVKVADAFGASPIPLGEVGAQLIEADIVIASTASPEYVITRNQVKNSLRKRRNCPLFFIDIAVPRDVEPQVNDLENVCVYDIDDLKGVAELNMAPRQQEAEKAERIVQEEVIKFEKWRKTLTVVPTIVSLKRKAESITQAELKKSSSALRELTPTQKEAVQTLISSITEKMLNDPILYLKRRAGKPVLNTYLDLTKELFNLDRDNGDAELRECIG